MPFRQWTLSFPKRIRWHLARDVRLTSTVLKLFVRALFGYQRRRGRELGLAGQGAACSFVQHFGGALQSNTHFHVLVPEGLFAAPSPGTEERATFLPLPSPDDEEVESLLRTVARRVVRLLKRLGRLDEDAFPEDALQALQAASIQRRLPLPRDDERPPPRKRRCAFLEGFSLHANTHTHAHDRHNLERLCRYGARGPLCLERLCWRDDGRLAYRLPVPTSSTSTGFSHPTPSFALASFPSRHPPPHRPASLLQRWIHFLPPPGASACLGPNC